MDTSALDAKPQTSAEWQEFYQRLEGKSTAALWEVLAEIVPREPRPACLPAIWRYNEVRPLLMEAGRRITAKEAERRVLILENPGTRGMSRITQTVYAGLQLVLPGETAPTHRHVASALRFVIESEGGYTAVDGERTTMRPGDFILTPSWTYHDHGNPGETPVIWLDGLDIPIVNFFETSFAEHHPEETQPVTRSEGDSLVRFGAGLQPLEYQSPRMSSPLFTYPYSRSRETLDRLYRNGPVHECHGVKVQFTNPATGGYPLPTIGAFLQLFPPGFRGAPYRSTDATVYCVVEGTGRSHVGKETFAWREHDVFVVPSWYPVSHEAEGESVLFSFSDRPAQKALGLWREQVPAGGA
ncbi:MAG: gentisate 1,2-dioxygenase [Terriglobia bacterium]|nr:MAG: gentisate 1,2-dioxygenase [Terriglobia bacterium]